MTQTTQQFIIARSKEISSQINALRQELAALRSLKSSLSSPKEKSVETKKPSLTFQNMIIAVLNDHPEHKATALEILKLIERSFNKKIQRSSISPQLSRLKDKGVLELVDNVWYLTETYKTKKKEAPEGASRKDSVLSELRGG